MNYYDVKFLLNLDDHDYLNINDAFNNAKSALNWQFDENFNANLIDNDIDYQVKDVSKLERNEIDKIIDFFFRFTFDNPINVPLYKFLVLKNNEKLKILANISSLIFDYSSINDFYELFNDLNKSYPKKDLDTYYSNIKDYLNCPNFEKDSEYWTKHIFNSNNYVNFYNLKDNTYKSQIINVDKDSVFTFIENHDCSLFDFYGCAFALYLSRINRIGGCLLKTIIPSKKSDSGVFDKSTLLRIDVNNDDYFNNLLNEFNSAFENASNHSTVDVENYLDENASYYSIYDFNDFDNNIRVYTLIENGRDRFNENFIGMTSNVMPLVADCKDQSINSFMENMADTVYGISRHSYYPILLLYQKYNFEVNILFQFVPNWIADDFINVEDIDSEEIMNHVLNSYSDYLTEFFVQIYQNGDNYRLIITTSNKYSPNLIDNFKDTYISILSNIINTDINSNLKSTLK